MRASARRILFISVAATATLAVPASASAIERFAAVGGSTVDPDCTATPCTLKRAVEVVAVDGDTVTVLPGSHNLTINNLTVSDDIELRGAPGQAIPAITNAANSSTILVTNAGASLQRLSILHNDPADGTTDALVVTVPAAVDQVFARSVDSNFNSVGCAYQNLPTGSNATISNSVCANTAANGQGLNINPGPGSTTVTLRNVTAVGGGIGIMSNTEAGETLNVNATDVIAGGANDVNAQGAGASTLTFGHSNYDNINPFPGHTITPVAPNVGNDPTNQTTPPVFVDAANGDFRQAPTSAGTIDLGSFGTDATTDFEGEPRCMGAAPDIGADEFTAAQCDIDGDGVPDVSDTCVRAPGPASNGGCPLPDTDGDGIPDESDTCPAQAAPGTADGCPAATPDTRKPQTTISKGPKGEVETNTVTFRFGSDEQGSRFQCRLVELVGGKGGRKAPRFKTCKSPRKLKNLDTGEYRFEVRATDAAGNTDSTPAKRKFEVVEEEGRGGR